MRLNEDQPTTPAHLSEGRALSGEGAHPFTGRPAGGGHGRLRVERDIQTHTWSVAPRRRFLVLALMAGLVLCARVPARADDTPADRAGRAAAEAAGLKCNAEAAVLYQRAITLDPSRRKEWLWKLAEQLTWSHQDKEAISLFREALASGLTGDDEKWARLRYSLSLRRKHQFREALRQCDLVLSKSPNDLNARLGRAETLAWWDKKDEAKREYEAVLRLDPDNKDARRDLGQLQSWRRQDRDAEHRLTSVLHDDPKDSWGALFLAQAQKNIGRPDRARQTLLDFLAAHPQDTLDKESGESIRHLLQDIELHQRPGAGSDFQISHQSDHLTIATQTFWQDRPLDDGRSSINPQYQRYDYNPEGGQPSIQVSRPGVQGHHRFNDATDVTGNLYVDVIQPQEGHKNHTELTYNTYVTLWPNDHFRFDVGSNRVTFDNIQSLLQGITGTYGTFSMDFLPDEATRFTARANYGAYSDGNEQRWTQLELERRVWLHPVVLIGARYTSMGFSEMLDHGYFNPSSYHSGVLTLHLYGSHIGRLFYDFDGSYGHESSNPGGGKPNSSAGAHLTYLLGKRWELQARYTYFSSLQASSGGFARRTTGIYLHFVW
jgi:tetratricopeptide (TPR) repeat protein